MSTPRVVALSGGIGGAKLALGLYRVLDPGALMVAANIGDDFEHLGLHVAPDLDTLMYTLAGVSNTQSGWGRANESWRFMEVLRELGGEDWFLLGDRDLATHVERTRRLRRGERLSDVTRHLCERLGIAAALVPATDDPVRTIVRTPEGEMAFQHYFVREQCRPVVTGFRFDGAERASAQPALLRALEHPALEAVVICPSNPFISIDPALAVPGVREALRACSAPVIAVSPIIGGGAVKGPTAKMMQELAMPVTSAAVAAHYAGIIDAIVVDDGDAAEADGIDAACFTTRILMRSIEDRERLAREVLAFAARART